MALGMESSAPFSGPWNIVSNSVLSVQASSSPTRASHAKSRLNLTALPGPILGGKIPSVRVTSHPPRLEDTDDT